MVSRPSNVTEDLLELESGFWNAAGNGSFYREHMAANGLCVLPVGVIDKDETVTAIEGSAPWAAYEFRDVRSLALGDDGAAICYGAEASREEDPTEYTALMSSVYTKVNGRWKLTLHQQTPIS